MTGKKVLIVSSLFYPEIAANSKRMTHLALALKESGYDISVLTALPYYPTNYVSPEKGKWLFKDDYCGIPVIRSYIFRSNKYENILKRILSFLSFMISSILASFQIKGRFDTVIVISPPFTAFFSGYIISKIKNAALILDIQDIYPETLVALGFLKNKIIIALLEWVEKFFYKKAARIAVISNGFRYNIIKKGADQSCVKIIPNWVDTELFKPNNDISLNGNLRSKYNLDNAFVVMFAGTMGFAQGLENIIRAANILKEYRDKIKFVLLGDGVEKKNLMQMVEEFSLTNICFIPPVPNSQIPEFLSIADVCLVHLRKNELYKITIPCKIYEYMAMEKPVIIGVGGDALDLIVNSGCGIGTEPESPDDLAGAVLELYNNSDIRMRMGENGRKSAVANYSKEKIISQYIDLIK